MGISLGSRPPILLPTGIEISGDGPWNLTAQGLSEATPVEFLLAHDQSHIFRIEGDKLIASRRKKGIHRPTIVAITPAKQPTSFEVEVRI
jgi:hypothetical protein